MIKHIFFLVLCSCGLLIKSNAQSWSLTGNSGTNPPTNFLGTKDGKALVFKTNNSERTRITPTGNIGIGVTNPAQRLDVNGNINLGKGFSLFMENRRVLRVDSTKANTFLGNRTGANTTGVGNTATGMNALYFNTKGSYNIAVGNYALYSNSEGLHNEAYGFEALYSNTVGGGNIAMGYDALYKNNSGSYNIAQGLSALYNNTIGQQNTAVGVSALYNNYGAWGNTALGYNAGNGYVNGYYNTFIGSESDALGNDIYNSVALGSSAIVTAPNQVRIGNAYTTSIGGYTNWSNISDGRVKKNIKENVPGLAFINKLKPVTYNLDLDAVDKIVQLPAAKDKDGKLLTRQPSQIEMNARSAKQQIVYTGFVAQDVEKAAKELQYDFSGVDAAKSDKDLYALRYADFVVPLVKAVQELSKRNDEKDEVINSLKSEIRNLKSEMSELKSVILSANSSTAKLKSASLTSASLDQNIPNPFNRATRIDYVLPQQFNSAKIVITDKSGKTLKQINVSGTGKGSLNIDASTLSSGTYQYSFYVDGRLIETKQMVVLK